MGYNLRGLSEQKTKPVHSTKNKKDERRQITVVLKTIITLGNVRNVNSGNNENSILYYKFKLEYGNEKKSRMLEKTSKNKGKKKEP